MGLGMLSFRFRNSDYLTTGIFRVFLLATEDPLVRFDLRNGESLFWDKLKDIHDEIFNFFMALAVDLVGSDTDSLLHGPKSFCLERSPSMDKLKEKDSECPNVDIEVVALLECHFGGHVLVGAAEGKAGSGDLVGGPSEVAELDIEIFVKQ